VHAEDDVSFTHFPWTRLHKFIAAEVLINVHSDESAFRESISAESMRIISRKRENERELILCAYPDQIT